MAPDSKTAGNSIILASASPRRVALLKNLGLEFSVRPADIDETVAPGLSPEEVVMSLARQKAAKVRDLVQEEGGREDVSLYVIAADTVVAQDDKILGKPQDRDDAIAMLSHLSGNSHYVFTGVTILKREAGTSGPWQELTDHGATKVYFRNLSAQEIAAYVDTEEPTDKAGAYALQGIGAFLIEGIEGCPANVIGLPVPKVLLMLRSLGLPVMGASGN